MQYELFFIGLLLSLVFIAVTGYYPGGIIVPGYLVLYSDQPLRITGTIIAGLMAYLIYRLASRYLILFGKRRFVFLILISAVLSFSFSYLVPVIFPASLELKMIGWVIPGLIANNFDRQGIIVTFSSMAIVLAVLLFISKIYFFFF
ncbi:MAG: poly-gamma-glutamate biosynthesis protein PgsC [Bacteroidia bacterium]|nr:poly-gamma-glutamate biosynthesis protein PgsC [Bacteroidia bacterium]